MLPIGLSSVYGGSMLVLRLIHFFKTDQKPPKTNAYNDSFVAAKMIVSASISSKKTLCIP